ncbi:hypothetical protein D3C72_1249220 [compost metagenome]
MAQALQRVIHPRCGKERQRLRIARQRLPGTVGNAVVHGVQVGQVEHVAHQQAPLGAQLAFDVVVVGKGKMDGNGLVAGAHFQLHTMVGDQQAKLLGVVVVKQVGPRQRGLVVAGAFDKAVGQLAVGACHGARMHAHKGVAGAVGCGGCFARHEALHGRAQEIDLFGVDRLHLRQRGFRRAVAGRCDKGRFGMGHAPLCNGPGCPA